MAKWWSTRKEPLVAAARSMGMSFDGSVAQEGDVVVLTTERVLRPEQRERFMAWLAGEADRLGLKFMVLDGLGWKVNVVRSPTAAGAFAAPASEAMPLETQRFPIEEIATQIAADIENRTGALYHALQRKG